jgi:hypothetical protein
MRPLLVTPAWRLAEEAPELRWLVTQLWSQHAVGIVGGEPKCCKSFLALDLAVAVAGGVPCLRRFAVPDPGRVLLFAAEDAPEIVRRRLQGIAAAAGVHLRNLDIQVITAPTLRLDLPADRLALQEAVGVLVDPVQAHEGIENQQSRLQSGCRIRTATLYERLAALTATGRIVRCGDQWDRSSANGIGEAAAASAAAIRSSMWGFTALDELEGEGLACLDELDLHGLQRRGGAALDREG